MDARSWVAAGIYDPSAPGADLRLALLEFLASHGVALEEMVAAEQEDRLPFAAAEALIRGGHERLTLAELSNRAGLPVDTVRRMWLADGFPDPGDSRPFSEANVEVLPLYTVAVELFGEDAALQVVRVMGWAMARLAEAELSAYIARVGGPLVDRGATELDLARTGVQVAQLLPPLARFLDLLHRHHIEGAIRRFGTTVDGLGLRRVGAPLAIGFADLTGFTALSQRLSTADLHSALTAFDTLAGDTVTATGSQLVKLIGDEVMFASPDAVSACRTARELLDAVADVEVLPPLRCGLAFGQVLTCDGDYYGPVVNLAARAVAAAEPTAVVVDGAVRERAGGHFGFASLGAHRLKGFDDPVELHRLLPDRP